jgi:myosin heavy subunit
MHVKRLTPGLCFLLMALFLAGIAAAEQCEVQATVGEIQKVQIGNETRFAISKAQLTQYTQLKQVVQELNEALKDRDELLKFVQNERNDLLRQLTEHENLTTRYAELQKKYASLNNDYQQSLIKSSELNEQFQTNSKKLIDLSKKYDTHIEDWRTHADECRTLASQSRGGQIQIDLGLGMTANESDMVGLIGVGVGPLKAWGYLENDNSSILLGTSLQF